MAENWLSTVTYVAALLAGIGVIWSVVQVSYRNHSWSFQGLGALTLGMVLMGMSVWSQVKITVEGGRLTAEVEKLEQENATIARQVLMLDEALQDTREVLAEVSANPTDTGPERRQMTKELRVAPDLNRAQLEQIIKRPTLQHR